MHHAFSTRAVHAGRKDLHRLGVHAPPIDLSSTYPIPDLSEAAASLAASDGRSSTATTGTPRRSMASTTARPVTASPTTSTSDS